jgi:large subunit ribosomal protein L24
MKIRVGDNVIVQAGKDRGKSGVISKIYLSQNKVLIEGVNAKTKHVKGRDGVPGDRTEIFVPIHVSNVAVVDPKSGEPTRVGYLVDAKGAKTRIAKKSGQAITKATAAKKEAPKKEVSKKEVKKIKA